MFKGFYSVVGGPVERRSNGGGNFSTRASIPPVCQRGYTVGADTRISAKATGTPWYTLPVPANTVP